MPLTRLKRRGNQRLYLPQQHHTAAAEARVKAVRTNLSQSLTIPDEWSDFELFAQQCRTRQRDGIKGLALYDWQRRVLALLEKHGSVVIAKSRQVGGSQIFITKALQLAITKPGFLGLIASKRSDDAMQLARRVRRALKGLPTDVKPVNDSLSQLVLSNDSQLLFRSSTPADSLSRSIDTLDFAIADEYSFWTDGQAEALGSLGPAMANSANPQLIIVSTPNGQSDDYWAKLTQGIGPDAFERKLSAIREGAEAPYQEIITGDFMPVAICHWKAIPQYANDANFKKRMVSKLGLSEEKWQQEFELNFEQSAQSVFSFSLVRNGIQNTLSDPPSNWDTKHWGSEIAYFCGIDPAGSGSDYTVAIILKRESNTYSVAAMYRKRAGTSQQHIAKITDLIEKYKPVKTVVETNSIGAVYFENISSVCTNYSVEGFYTSQQKKDNIIGRIVLALESNHLKYPEGPISDELLGFQRVGKRLEAGHGHDDTVIGLALALEAADYGKPEKSSFGFISVNMDY